MQKPVVFSLDSWDSSATTEPTPTPTPEAPAPESESESSPERKLYETLIQRWNDAGCWQIGVGEEVESEIPALEAKGYKVTKIVHTAKGILESCCENCYRTNIYNISWLVPQSPYFLGTARTYFNGVNEEIQELITKIDEAKGMQQKSIEVEGINYDETEAFLTKLGCNFYFKNGDRTQYGRDVIIEWQS
jgi:hypothetical protein